MPWSVLNISVLFLIGGDGTLRAANRISEEIRRHGSLKKSVIVIPKTIDNDIPLVQRSFGFDTAVEMATEAIRAAHTEALGAPRRRRPGKAHGPLRRLRGRQCHARPAGSQFCPHP